MNAHEKPVAYAPTAGLTYDPSEPKYWDEDALQGEITRAFEICHGCRMCFKYCDSFPTLFALVDDKYDGDVAKVDAHETERIMDACFQCKLCEVQCPYTPRDQHAFQLDFPKLVHRFKAVRGKKQGFTLRDRVFGDPDRAGQLARLSFGLANTMNRVGAHRWMMEKMLGIHRDKELPEFASSTFERWAESTGRTVSAPGTAQTGSAQTGAAQTGTAQIGTAEARSEETGRAQTSVETVLFQTCYVQNNEPEIGRDTIEVLEANQVKTACLKGLACCGMPAWEHGDLDRLRAHAHTNLDLLMPFVEAGAKVLAINPTCSMMMRREYPELLEGADRERAKKLSAAVMDPSEFLWSIRAEARFKLDVKSKPDGPIAYHAPCHLRAQAVGFKSRDLFKKLLGAKVNPVMECCGHDGTYAMTVEGFEPSQRAGQRSFDEMKNADSAVWSTDCPLAAIQFHQHAGVKPMHPMTILARAYRGDPFPPAPKTKESSS